MANKVKDYIALVTAIIALITAILSLIIGYIKMDTLIKQQNEINTKTLKLVNDIFLETKKVALDLTIESPRGGEIIRDYPYNEMRGTYSGVIPDGYELWVLARDEYNFYIMYPPTVVTPTMGNWSQTGITLRTPGRWELHVCLVNQQASQWIQTRVSLNDWSGFPTINDKGMATVKFVVVTKE
jgi:hypothetical protein